MLLFEASEAIGEPDRFKVNQPVGRRGRMELLTKIYVQAREWHKGLSKGQTMTEYALILAAVAVVVFVTYQVMGNDISVLVNKIDTDLTTAAS